MSFCTNCGYQLGQADKFCPSCGKAVAVQQEVETPVYAAPAQTPCTPPAFVEPVAVAEPVVVAAPVVSVKTKVLGFVGMGLGIGGLFFAALGILYTLIGMVEEGMGFAFALAFSMFSMPLSIVGRILSNKSKQENFNSTPCTVGANLGLAGIIVTGVMLFFGIINLMV